MDSTRLSHALPFRLPRRAFDNLGSSSLLLLVMPWLLFASGCASRDWIDRTLVTVDVTGTWSGRPEGSQFGRPSEIFLELKQEGPNVTGTLRSSTTQATSETGPLAGPISGTVAGDEFRFKNSRGTVEGQLAVGGDEMTGVVSITGTRPITLRRLAPAARQ